VGREGELESLERTEQGVAVITGIGGQGKSALVSKYLETWIGNNPDGFWDWRDCREESDRFFTQLIALMEHLTEGQLSADFSNVETRAVVRYLFELVGEKKGVIVLDNVDSYVNQFEEKFTLGVGVFIQEALRVAHNFLVILTCRPRVFYPSPRFLEIPLHGIALPDAIDLFRLRGVKVKDSNRSEIEEIWERTEGHPLWLNLIAVQMFRSPLTAPNILQELRKGQVDDRTRSMFRALWKGLNDRQRILLRCMAEISYPEGKDSIKNFVGALIRSPNHFNRAFEGLKSLSLVVERGSDSGGSRFDLHPLVRSFVRTEYSAHKERLPYIQTILGVLIRLITGLEEPSKEAPLEDLQRWTTKAELELASSDRVGALKTLASAADQLIARAFHEEFFRVAKLILEEVDWDSIEMQDLTAFHDVIGDAISSLVEHNRQEEARQYLNRYEAVTENRTVARLRFCKVACYLEWIVGNYEDAIALGREGLTLKSESDIDTTEDTSNTLALALRDNGNYDEALKLFAPDQTIEEILDEDHRTSGRNASFYGNVGRCLQFKGQLDYALNCYVKSARLLQNSSGAVDVLNKGYAALWIGETLEGLGDHHAAYYFYRQAVYIWSKRAPLRVAVPIQKLEKFHNLEEDNRAVTTENAVDIYCRSWISTWENQRSVSK